MDFKRELIETRLLLYRKQSDGHTDPRVIDFLRLRIKSLEKILKSENPRVDELRDFIRNIESNICILKSDYFNVFPTEQKKELIQLYKDLSDNYHAELHLLAAKDIIDTAHFSNPSEL